MDIKKILLQIVLITGLFNTQISFAQQKDPFENELFPPELVMQNQKAIELSDEQRNFIIQEMQEKEKQFNPLHWSLQKEMEMLKTLLSLENPDEGKIELQLNKALEIENKIKRLQIQLLIRIKNKLTAEQKIQLRALNKKSPKLD